MKTLKVGLTGGIGAGKSEALKAFARSGAATLSLDQVSRRTGPILRRLFGTSDRAEIAKLVFADPRARRKLERATHPVILKEMRAWLRKQKGVAVVEVPLLFEAGVDEDFDVTVAVTSRKRRGDPRRAKAQLPPRKKAELADVVIKNDGTLAALRGAVKEYQDAFSLIVGGRNG